VTAGVDAEQFWRMTPYQTALVAAATRDHSVTLAWQVAALSRQKKLPRLSTLLTSRPKRDMQDLKRSLQSLGRHV